MSLKNGEVELKEFICNYITKLNNSKDTGEVKKYLKDIQNELEKLNDVILVAEYKKDIVYQENEFSTVATSKSIMKAKGNAVNFLEKLLSKFEKPSIEKNHENDDLFTEEIALCIINRLLKNFYFHIEEMYHAHVHGKAHITREKLDEIKIGNEYDVQRILYSILKPIFPEARLEVSDDNGYGTSRYDIFIEKYNVVIEVKCSRPSMTDKSLREELGSDIFHYNYSNIFFFIYDKTKIITNRTAFVDTYTCEFDNKKIKTILIQPISL